MHVKTIIIKEKEIYLSNERKFLTQKSKKKKVASERFCWWVVLWLQEICPGTLFWFIIKKWNKTINGQCPPSKEVEAGRQELNKVEGKKLVLVGFRSLSFLRWDRLVGSQIQLKISSLLCWYESISVLDRLDFIWQKTLLFIHFLFLQMHLGFIFQKDKVRFQ